MSAQSAIRKFDSLEQEVFLNLWRTYDRMKALEDEVFIQVGLSAQQYNALRLLRAVHPATMPTLVLGSRLISRAPDVTRLLDRLEHQGLLHRQRRVDNRRVVDVGITPKGLKLLDSVREAVVKCHQRQLGHMSVRSLRRLASLLREARQPHEDFSNPSLVDG